jgi:hypothetical protein
MKKAILAIAILLIPITSSSQEIGNYLILQDIGPYKMMGQGGGQGSGIISAAGHFRVDHTDKSYGALYFSETTEIGVKAEVTQHAGADSDTWMFHEVEDSFRDPDMETLGLLTEGTVLRKIGTDKVFWIGLGGGSFMWLSNNVVVQVWYTDLQGTKPEPLEIVQAYLQMFPSTIPANLVLDKAHDEKWIKDEMERRLWLCDKWFQQLDEGKTKQYKALSAVVNDHLDVFLDYREKYYGISAGEDQGILYQYLQAKNEAGIRKKLSEYKNWWSSNKTRAPAL